MQVATESESIYKTNLSILLEFFPRTMCVIINMSLQGRTCFSFVIKLSFDINSISRNKPLNLLPVCVRTGCVVEHLSPNQDRTVS